MEKVIEILNKLKESSGNRLQEILEENRENQLLKDVLYFVYNPYITTGLSSKKINKTVSMQKEYKAAEDVVEVFNYLIKHNTGTDTDIAYVNEFILDQEPQYWKTYEQIFTKELKLGITAKTINKVWDNLIPEFNVMLAEKYWDKMEELEKDKPTIIITQKLDRHKGGCKCSKWRSNNIFKTGKNNRRVKRFRGRIKRTSKWLL